MFLIGVRKEVLGSGLEFSVEIYGCIIGVWYKGSWEGIRNWVYRNLL